MFINKENTTNEPHYWQLVTKKGPFSVRCSEAVEPTDVVHHLSKESRTTAHRMVPVALAVIPNITSTEMCEQYCSQLFINKILSSPHSQIL